MSKKDKLALTISAVVLLWSIAILFAGGGPIGVLGMTGLIIYWGIRYSKNDISFIKEK